MTSDIKTRILIFSDTHGKQLEYTDSLPACDVVIHCGDLTDGSKLEEYRTTIRWLTQLKAPLKLVIAGNHDFAMDPPAFEKKVVDATQPLEPDLVEREYGVPGEARKLFEDAKDTGIVFLDEGMHRFRLANGAQLSVYASPYTPSMGHWGFQYHPNNGHDFEIEEGVDIAITHGPPRGIMDYTHGRERAGCPDLFAAIAKVRPRIHCFGHIHEGWGARLVTWKDGVDHPTHFTAIDNENSPVIEKLAGLRESKNDSEEDIKIKNRKLDRMNQDNCCMTAHCSENEHDIEHGKHTLFVNASIEGCEDFEQRPWLIDIALPKPDTGENRDKEANKSGAPPSMKRKIVDTDGQVSKRSKLNN